VDEAGVVEAAEAAEVAGTKIELVTPAAAQTLLAPSRASIFYISIGPYVRTD
jgi:hypothetical protein